MSFMLKDQEVDRIYDEIRINGFCRLMEPVSADALRDARNQAEQAVARNKGEYVAFDGPGGLTGELLSALDTDPGLRALCTGLYERAVGTKAPNQGYKQVFRCLKGGSARKHSYYLHFDSYVVTVLIPIAVPNEPPTGDLILLRRRRRLVQTYAKNVLQKAIFDRKFAQMTLWWLIRRRLLTTIRLRLEPGAVYLFFGYSTLHANEACAQDALRATLLFHFGNPHKKG